MAASYVKFYQFVEDLAKGLHHLHAAGDALYVYLTNNTPDQTNDLIKTDLVGITEQNGYAAADIANDISESGGVCTLTAVDVEWTATGAGFGPFRYVVIYNETCASPVDPLVCYFDYGSSISCSVGEKFKVDFGASLFTIT
jgi:hypothetical protein